MSGLIEGYLPTDFICETNGAYLIRFMYNYPNSWRQFFYNSEKEEWDFFNNVQTFKVEEYYTDANEIYLKIKKDVKV